jgi:hypothetical protein
VTQLGAALVVKVLAGRAGALHWRRRVDDRYAKRFARAIVSN